MNEVEFKRHLKDLAHGHHHPEEAHLFHLLDDLFGVLVRVLQALRVRPKSGASVRPFVPNSGVVVLPIITAPASRNRAVGGASSNQS